jgi:hypothetical protein
MGDVALNSKPESQWTKGEWKAEALRLREELAAATAFAMTPPEPIRVDDEQAGEKIRQLRRQLHNVTSGKELGKLESIRQALARVEAPVDHHALEGLRGLVRR